MREAGCLIHEKWDGKAEGDAFRYCENERIYNNIINVYYVLKLI